MSYLKPHQLTLQIENFPQNFPNNTTKVALEWPAEGWESGCPCVFAPSSSSEVVRRSFVKWLLEFECWVTIILCSSYDGMVIAYYSANELRK